MAKRMDAASIIEAISQLEETTKRDLLKDIVDTLKDGWRPMDGDEDTWAAGFQAAIAVIENNF